MPPTTQSAISAKSDVITATWNPRLVNTPVPTMLATTRFVAVTAEIFFSIVSGLVLEQALVSRGAADLSTQIAGLFSLSVRVSQLALEPDDVVQCDDADGRRIRLRDDRQQSRVHNSHSRNLIA